LNKGNIFYFLTSILVKFYYIRIVKTIIIDVLFELERDKEKRN